MLHISKAPEQEPIDPISLEYSPNEHIRLPEDAYRVKELLQNDALYNPYSDVVGNSGLNGAGLYLMNRFPENDADLSLCQNMCQARDRLFKEWSTTAPSKMLKIVFARRFLWVSKQLGAAYNNLISYISSGVMNIPKPTTMPSSNLGEVMFVNYNISRIYMPEDKVYVASHKADAVTVFEDEMSHPLMAPRIASLAFLKSERSPQYASCVSDLLFWAKFKQVVEAGNFGSYDLGIHVLEAANYILEDVKRPKSLFSDKNPPEPVLFR